MIEPIGFYETEDEYIGRLEASNAKLVAALKEMRAAIDSNSLSYRDLLKIIDEALANQQSTEKP